MDQITIRLATSDDLITIADLCYETRVLQQQADSRLTVTSDSKAIWIREAGNWLNDPRCTIWVSVRMFQVTGYLIAWLHDMPPGMLPSCVGLVADMAVDLHSSSGGAGQYLLTAAHDWFSKHRVENMIVSVPHRQPVQQAFWRAQGAKTWVDLMWLKL
jgi:hypothetical protein